MCSVCRHLLEEQILLAKDHIRQTALNHPVTLDEIMIHQYLFDLEISYLKI